MDNLMKIFLFSSLLFFSILYFLPIKSHAQWQTDVQLTNDNGTSLTSETNIPSIAVEANIVHVVWYDDRDGNTEIYYKRSIDAGVTWGGDIRLTFNDANSMEPAIAVSGSTVHIVWYDYRNLTGEIYYKRSTDAGLSWSSDSRLTNGSADSSESQWSNIAVSGQVVHVIWSNRKQTLINNIYHKRSADGGSTWSGSTQVTDNNSAYISHPSISVSNQAVHIVMTDSRAGDNWNLFYVHSLDGGLSWGVGTWLTSNNGGPSWFPCISTSGSNVHVAFFSDRDLDREVYYKRSTNGGFSWELDYRLTNSPAPSEWPSISASGQMVHIVWKSAANLNYKLSTDGGLNWGTSAPLSSVLYNPSIVASGSIVHILWTWTTGNFEIYYKRNPTGNTTSIKSLDMNVPNDFSLLQNYPNPFNPSTKIKFSITTTAKVQLFIFNLLGEKVAELVNGRLDAGYYEAVWDAFKFSSGVYFYRLTTSNIISTKKMILLQ
jgi:hypothetical protein